MRGVGFEPTKALSHEISYLVKLLSLSGKRHLKSRAFDRFAIPAQIIGIRAYYKDFDFTSLRQFYLELF